jgi:signal transduction histidine kinase
MNVPSRQPSIAAKLTWMNVLVSGIALILVYVSYLAYNVYSFRNSAIESLSAEARILGANSVSAIVFDDKASAEATLSALRYSSEVVDAEIYTQAGTLFAQYPANGPVPPPPHPMPEMPGPAHWANGADVVVGSRIGFQGKQICTVYVHAHLEGMKQQAVEFAVIAGGILLLCLGVALLVGSSFRRILAQPIVSLAQTARMVSRYRDYSLRFASERSFDELASLTDAFNEMLGEIQQRDRALEQSKVDLELRVEERTAELQAANRELEAFSYTVAHDMRAPLQTISNVCYLILETDRGQSSEEEKHMVLQLRASVVAMSSMIDDLLDLSLSTSAPLRSTRLNLSSIAGSILQGLAEANPERRVKTVIQKQCYANADSGLMQIVLQNLLRNAWKFTSKSEEAQIEFGCTKRGADTVFYVRDNGAGFDQSLAGRLFKPFQRLHAASEFPGTGIGLATVQRIIRRHGGEVWAEGEIDKGATFYFTVDSPRS